MMKAQEEGKLLLCWTLISSGARQVLTLGYHRKLSMRNDPPELAEEKRQVFWAMYTMDKNLALTLGYSPTIQDYDIDVELFGLSPDPGVAAWDKAFIATIELSRLQGLIYERLYSLQALNATATAKAQNVDDLAHRLERWHTEFSPVSLPSHTLWKIHNHCIHRSRTSLHTYRSSSFCCTALSTSSTTRS